MGIHKVGTVVRNAENPQPNVNQVAKILVSCCDRMCYYIPTQIPKEEDKVKMRWSILFLLSTAAVAQNGPCSEAAIRNSIETKKITVADDAYFFSAHYNEPMIGKAAMKQANDNPVAPTKNDAPAPLKPDKIVVAPSGDMAYEYGTSHIVRDRATGEHQDFMTAYLRVWKAVGDTCEEAALESTPENTHPQNAATTATVK